MSQPSNKTTIQEIVKLFNIKREQMNKSNTPIEFEIRMDKKLIKKSEYENIFKVLYHHGFKINKTDYQLKITICTMIQNSIPERSSESIVCREEKDFTPASLSKKLKSIAEKSVEDTDVSSSDVRVWYAYVSALIAIGEKNEATVTCNQILANACRNTGEVDYDFKQFMNVQGATNLVVIKLEMMLKLPIVDEHGYPQIYNSGDKNIAVVENMDLNSKNESLDYIDKAIYHLHAIVTQGAIVLDDTIDVAESIGDGYFRSFKLKILTGMNYSCLSSICLNYRR